MQFFRTPFSSLKIMLAAKFSVRLTAGSIACGCFELLHDRTHNITILLDLQILLAIIDFGIVPLAIAQFPANVVELSGNVRFLAPPIAQRYLNSAFRPSSALD
jgi:hypothetical protein